MFCPSGLCSCFVLQTEPCVVASVVGFPVLPGAPPLVASAGAAVFSWRGGRSVAGQFGGCTFPYLRLDCMYHTYVPQSVLAVPVS